MENNKSSINIENQLSKQFKSGSKDNEIDKNKSDKHFADDGTAMVTCGLGSFASKCISSPNKKPQLLNHRINIFLYQFENFY